MQAHVLVAVTPSVRNAVLAALLSADAATFQALCMHEIQATGALMCARCQHTLPLNRCLCWAQRFQVLIAPLVNAGSPT